MAAIAIRGPFMHLSVCIFARNEARNLAAAIASFSTDRQRHDLTIHIMVNGCTDDTLFVARTLAAADPSLTIVESALADKAHAWNDYVLRVAPEADAHIFMDGDIRARPGALGALAHALADHPEARAAAAFPINGRSRKAWRRQLLEDRAVSGNLYALSQATIEKFRSADLRLPFGAKGEDGILSYLLLTDFNGGEDLSAPQSVVPALDALFEFDSLSPNLRDLRVYARRLKRYSERHYQKQILYDRYLKPRGAQAMPNTVFEIYTRENLARVRPRLHPVNLWFDLATREQLRRLTPPTRASST